MNTLRAPAVRYPWQTDAVHVYGSHVPRRTVLPSGASPSTGEAISPRIPTTAATTTAKAATAKMIQPRPERRRAGRAEAAGGWVIAPQRYRTP